MIWFFCLKIFAYLLLLQSIHSEASALRFKMANGNVMTIPITENENEINITEELTRTSVWRSLPGNSVQNEKRKSRKCTKNHDTVVDVSNTEDTINFWFSATIGWQITQPFTNFVKQLWSIEIHFLPPKFFLQRV